DAREEASLVEKINGLIKAKNYMEALNEVDEALQVNQTSRQLLFIRGKLASRLKRYDLAEISFQDALAKNADNIEALIELGGLAEAQSKWDKALHYWNVCIPKTKNPKQKIDALTAKGEALSQLGDFDEAEKTYKRLKMRFSGNYRGWLGLANIARIRGDWQSAKTKLQDCLKQFPNHRLKSKWKLQIAECMLHLSEFEEASAIYTSIPGNHPGHITALEAMAKSAMASKQWDQAIEHYERCASLLPTRHKKALQWRLRVGELMIKSGRKDEAETLFQELSNIYPDHSRVEKGCERLRNLIASA
ncbi:MAG: tetratricopeptide repeat protein, partial [Nitrospira sp.]|nr:tetratricopeptide repeat protein [Nitrospira sp.]